MQATSSLCSGCQEKRHNATRAKSHPAKVVVPPPPVVSETPAEQSALTRMAACKVSQLPGAVTSRHHGLGDLGPKKCAVSRSQKSETKVSAGPGSLCRLQGRFLPCLFQPWWPQAFLGLWPHRSDLCLCLLLAVSSVSLCVCSVSHWIYTSTKTLQIVGKVRLSKHTIDKAFSISLLRVGTPLSNVLARPFGSPLLWCWGQWNRPQQGRAALSG